MSLASYIFFGIVGVLLLAFGWVIRAARNRRNAKAEIGALGDTGRMHVTYLPQIRQALSKADADFLSKRATNPVRQRAQRERRRAALAHLTALHVDFQSLLRMARIIAVLSPEVEAVQEFERLRLTVKFNWNYQLIRMQLRAGFEPLLRLDGLSNLVSGLSVRMETALKELGERAALAGELASALNRSGVDPG